MNNSIRLSVKELYSMKEFVANGGSLYDKTVYTDNNWVLTVFIEGRDCVFGVTNTRTFEQDRLQIVKESLGRVANGEAFQYVAESLYRIINVPEKISKEAVRVYKVIFL